MNSLQSNTRYYLNTLLISYPIIGFSVTLALSSIMLLWRESKFDNILSILNSVFIVAFTLSYFLSKFINESFAVFISILIPFYFLIFIISLFWNKKNIIYAFFIFIINIGILIPVSFINWSTNYGIVSTKGQFFIDILVIVFSIGTLYIFDYLSKFFFDFRLLKIFICFFISLSGIGIPLIYSLVWLLNFIGMLNLEVIKQIGDVWFTVISFSVSILVVYYFMIKKTQPEYYKRVLLRKQGLSPNSSLKPVIDYIQKGSLGEALLLLQKLSELNNNFLNTDIHLLLQRYSTIESDRRNNLIPYDEYQIELAKITKSTLELTYIYSFELDNTNK